LDGISAAIGTSECNLEREKEKKESWCSEGGRGGGHAAPQSEQSHFYIAINCGAKGGENSIICSWILRGRKERGSRQAGRQVGTYSREQGGRQQLGIVVTALGLQRAGGRRGQTDIPYLEHEWKMFSFEPGSLSRVS
jgi:hypothetical protein